MFKISNDRDDDDVSLQRRIDFLESEFTDDFLTNTIVLNEGSNAECTSSVLQQSGRGFPARPSNPSFGECPQKKSFDRNDITSSFVCSRNENKAPRGFQPKTKSSPVLNSAETRSPLLRTEPPLLPFKHRAEQNPRCLPPANDASVLSRKGISNLIEEFPAESVNLRLPQVALNTLESRNSAFLAEWNDDSFFDPPKKEQPIQSPVIRGSTPEIVTRRVSKTVRQRRFPGPAGLLPPRLGNTSLVAPEEFLNELKSEDNDPSYQETEILSQSSGSIFEGGAWSAMLEDLGPPGHSLLKSMNVSSIKGVSRNVRSYKVPFLSVLVQSIDGSLPDAAVVLKDPTGEMHGVIHRDVWEQFSSDIAVGTVLVLRNVGIISAGVSARKNVVNITGNNLTAIYSPKDELNIQLRRIHEFAADNSLKLLNEWEKVESLTTHPASPSLRGLQMQSRCPPLFNGFQARGHTAGSPSSSSVSRPNTSTLQRPVNSRARPTAPFVNPNRVASATTPPSPFSPMKSRQSTALLNSPFNSNIENSGWAGNQKPAQQPSFVMKTPASSRPPHNREHSSPANRSDANPSAFQLPFSSSTKASSSNLPMKKPKLCQAVTSSKTTHPISNSAKHNPFQVDTDNSEIDSLFEGIDTDSLFGDF